MTRKLFGTDGVRGVAGEFLTAELALALGRAATRRHRRRAPAGADRARHPRVGRDAAGGARRRRQRGRRRRAARRRAADAGRAAADRSLRLRPRGRAVRLAQPLPRQRHQVLRGRRLQALRRDRAGDRARARAARRQPVGARARRSGASASCGARPRTTCASCTRAFAELDLDGVDVLLDCANGATYQVAPEIFRRLGATRVGDRRHARRAQHQRRLRLDAHRGARASGARVAGTRSASRSTATATACSRSTAAETIVDGDELMALATLHLRDSGRLSGDGVAVTVMTNYGFHSAMERAGVAVRHDPGRRPLRARGAARARLDARRRAVRPHHRHGLQPHRRRHRQRAADARGARREGPQRARRDVASCRSAWSTCACATAARSSTPHELEEAVRAAEQELPGAGACSCAPAAPSRSCG